jgi:hypothetical protein
METVPQILTWGAGLLVSVSAIVTGILQFSGYRAKKQREAVLNVMNEQCPDRHGRLIDVVKEADTKRQADVATIYERLNDLHGTLAAQISDLQNLIIRHSANGELARLQGLISALLQKLESK